MNGRLHSLLVRLEERGALRDSIGNFEAQHVQRRWLSPLYFPVINDAIVRHDSKWLEEIRWPKGKRFAACLTHDIDSVLVNSRRELARTIGLHMRHASSRSEQMKHALSFVGLRKNPMKLDIFTPWIELEASHGFHSSFFFFATKISHRHVRDNVYRWDDPTFYRGGFQSVKDAIRDIYDRGWDVGLHGSIHSADNPELLIEQKEDLEQALGNQVYTTRQHNLQYDVEATPRVQDYAGFQADSTLGFNRDIGFRAGIAYPFRQWDILEQRWLGIIQIPLVLHDGAILRRDNLDLDEATAFQVCKQIINRVAASRGVISLLWHPNGIIKPGWWSLYERLLQYIDEQGGWGASMKEIRDWWLGQGLYTGLERRIKELEERDTTEL